MKYAHTIVSGAVEPGDYETEVARRMWCAAVYGVDEDDDAEDDETEELRDCGLAATSRHTTVTYG